MPERLSAFLDFDLFRLDLAQALPRSEGSTSKSPFNLMFKVLILQSSHTLSDESTEFLIKERPPFMRLLGLGFPIRRQMPTRSGPSVKR